MPPGFLCLQIDCQLFEKDLGDLSYYFSQHVQPGLLLRLKLLEEEKDKENAEAVYSRTSDMPYRASAVLSPSHTLWERRLFFI